MSSVAIVISGAFPVTCARLADGWDHDDRDGTAVEHLAPGVVVVAQNMADRAGLVPRDHDEVVCAFRLLVDDRLPGGAPAERRTDIEAAA